MQKSAYEMRISDWSSDVCSSDLSRKREREQKPSPACGRGLGEGASAASGSTRTVHRMGDLGYFDADGRLWFCGRKSQRVVAATRSEERRVGKESVGRCRSRWSPYT